MTTTTKQARFPLIALSLALASLLTACGGGSGGGSNSTNPTNPDPAPVTVPAGTTLVATNYATGSAKGAIFKTINDYRAQCGFPGYKQNTMLDESAQNHATYMASNGGVITDSEVKGNPGFTGITGQDRAGALGWPSAIGVGAANTGAVYTNSTLTQAEYGKSMVDAWSVGVYHQAVIAGSTNLLGVGVSQITHDGFPQVQGGVALAYDGKTPTATTSTGPLTFPCQGVTGVPHHGVNELPVPPGTSGSWGTPVTVAGNTSDTISLTSATMTSTAGTITLQILNSDTDPAKLIAKYQAVAYPTSPLQPNTTYTVNLTGIYNGVTFSRTFTFTTGNLIA